MRNKEKKTNVKIKNMIAVLSTTAVLTTMSACIPTQAQAFSLEPIKYPLLELPGGNQEPVGVQSVDVTPPDIPLIEYVPNIRNGGGSGGFVGATPDVRDPDLLLGAGTIGDPLDPFGNPGQFGGTFTVTPSSDTYYIEHQHENNSVINRVYGNAKFTFTIPAGTDLVNFSYLFRAYDKAQNDSSTSYPDNGLAVPTAPIINSSTTSPTKDPIQVSIGYSTDSTKKEYRLDGGAWLLYTSALTISKNTLIEARGTNSSGGISTISSYQVSNIDNIPPANATLSASTTSPTNQNVSVTISYPSGMTNQYKIGSTGIWTSYSVPVVLTSNDTIYARSIDSVGNISNVTSLAVTNIDKIAPTSPNVSADVTTATNNSVVLTATFSADSVTKQYRVNGGVWNSYTTPVTMAYNGSFEVRGLDSAGNSSLIKTYTVSNIDKTAPVNATLSASTTAPTNDNVDVTILYPTDASVKQYKVGTAGTWTAYTAPVVVSSNNTVYARSYDAVGNLSSEASLVVSNIDKVAPTTPSLSADKTTPVNTDVKVSATFPGDSVKNEVRKDNGSWVVYSTAVNFTANGKLEARSTDIAGNISAVGTYNVSNIDKTAPVNATFSASTTAPINENVSLTISYPADASVKQYKVGTTGTWTAYTVPVVVSSNNTVYARSYDAVGNLSSEASFAVANIDKVEPTTPTLSADKTAPVNTDVKVSATFPNDSVKNEVRKDNGAWVVYSSEVNFTANGKLEARSTDNAGNISAVGTYNVSNIDKTAPVNATLSASTTAPTNENVDVTISYPADASVKQYKVGATGTWTNYSTPIALTSNATVYARSYDGVGNLSSESSLVVSNIDKVAPTTPTLSADKTTPVNTDVTVSVTFPTDSVKNEVRKDNGTWVVYSGAVNFTVNGKFEARSTDNAGNVSAVGTYTVSNIDKSAPVNATLLADKTVPTNTNVTVSINYPADASVKQYKVGTAGTWTAYTAPVVVSSNNTVYARSYDAVGNLSSEASLAVSNIDKVAPTTPTLSADKTTPVNTDVKVSVTFPADSIKNEVRKDNGTWEVYSTPVNFTVNGRLEARSTDNAGNVSAVDTYVVSNIDKTAPVNATISASTTAPTNENVSVTISYPTDASVKQYKIGTAGTWTSYTTPVVLSSNETIYARSIDAVGNISNTSSLTIANIDKVAPTTPSLSADKTAPVNTDVKVSATFPNDSVKNEVRKDNGTWVVYSGEVNFTANGKLEARSTDNAGNVSAVGVYNVTNIDKVAPTTPSLSADKTTPVNTDVKVTATFPTDSVKNEVRKDNGSWIEYTGEVNFTANGKLEARSTDNAGNVSVVGSYNVSNIDKVSPTVPSLSADKTAPVNTDVKVAVTFPNDSVKNEVRKDNGTWVTYSSAVNFITNGKLEARSTDNAGNVSAVGTYNVSNIDKTAPVNATLSANETSPTNTNVSVTILYPTDASIKEYKVGTTGTWTNYSSPITLTSNNTVYARSYDAVGNLSSESSLVVSNIDKVAPTTPILSADKTTSVNTDVKVSAIFPSDSVKNEVRKDNGSWVIYSDGVIFTVNGKLEARSTDNAGNVSSIDSYIVSNIDKTAPVNATLSANETSPTNTNVLVTISYPEDATVKQYKIGSTGIWTSYTTPVVLTSNNTVYARSYDAVGNDSPQSSLVVTNIDKVVPTTPTLSADKTTPVNTDVKVSAVFPEDSVKNEYSKDGEVWTAYEGAVNFTANGNLRVRSTDNAGNVSTIGTYTVSNIDKTAPVNATLSTSTTDPTNNDVSVAISYPVDGIVKQYKVGSKGTWTAYTTPVVLSTNEEVFARSYDAVGNVSKETSVSIANIDKVAPTTPTLSADKTALVNTDVIVSLIFASDSVKNEIRKDDGMWTTYSEHVTFNKNGKLEARSVDSAGNISEVGTYTVSNIDKVLPTSPLLSSNTSTFIGENVEVSIVYPVDSDKKEYRIDGGQWTIYTTPVVMTKNGKVEARAIDKATNVSSISSLDVNNIDKTAPSSVTIVSVENLNTVTVSNISDDYSGVKETRYRLNGGAWRTYVDMLELADGQYKVEIIVEDKAGNTSEITTVEVDLYKERLAKAIDSVNLSEEHKSQTFKDTALALVAKLPSSPEKTALTNRLDEVQRQIDTKKAIELALSSDTPFDFSDAQAKIDTVTDKTVKAILQAELDTQKEYLDRLVEAEKLVTTAETVKTQASVDSAREYVKTLEADEQIALNERLDDVQAIIDAQTAIELASKTRNPVDVQDAKDKIELLDQSNPVVVVIMDEMNKDFETVDILSLVSKERYDVLLAKYKMTKVAYNSLSQSYYAIKYTGDSMYKMANEKFQLVPSTDAYYVLVKEQFDNLDIDYTEFVEERTASDAELRATSAVSSLEKNYIVSMVPSVQLLVDAVEDETVQADLEARMAQAKLAYEQKLRDEALTRAETLVLNAEKYKYETYVTMAQKEVSALPEGELKDSLQARLDALKSPALDQDKAIAKAKADIGFATKYRYEYYFKRAQASIDLVTDSVIRAELQAQLDALK